MVNPRSRMARLGSCARGQALMQRVVVSIAVCVSALVSSQTVAAEPAFPGSTFSHIGDLALPTWTFAFALPEDALDGSVYLLGGSDYSAVWSRMVRRYSLSDASWQVFPDALPYAWYNNERHNAAIASNGKIYLGPGNGSGGFGQHDRIIEFDPSTGIAIERNYIIGPGAKLWGVAIAPAPASRGGVYLFGGWNGSGIGQVRHYDPTSDQFTVIGNLSVPRTVGVRIAHPAGRIYLFGGNTNGSLSAVDVLETTAELVRPVANPPASD